MSSLIPTVLSDDENQQWEGLAIHPYPRGSLLRPTALETVADNHGIGLPSGPLRPAGKTARRAAADRRWRSSCTMVFRRPAFGARLMLTNAPYGENS
jgi:hypothetical protein